MVKLLTKDNRIVGTASGGVYYPIMVEKDEFNDLGKVKATIV